MYYFHDSGSNEVDLIVEKNGEQFGVEIKASTRPDRNDMKGLLYWKKTATKQPCIITWRKQNRNNIRRYKHVTLE